MSYNINVEKVQNGYLLSWKEEYNDTGKEFTVSEVIQDDDADELKSGEELLWRLMEYFGLRGSKHDSERLSIERTKYES